jgi:hypothetical protein
VQTSDACAGASCEAWDQERVAEEKERAAREALQTSVANLLQDEKEQLEAALGRARAQLGKAHAAAD